MFPIESIERGFASATSGAKRTLIGKVAHSSDPMVQNSLNFLSQNLFVKTSKVVTIILPDRVPD